MREVICEKVTKAQEKITTIADYLYQEKEKEAYIVIDELLTILMELNAIIVEANQQGENFPFDEEGFKNTLLEAMKALEQKDMVLFADILQYEVGEQIQEWLNW